MPRARGSDGEEKGESSATRTSSFKDLFLDWDGPDLVFNTVSDWIHDGHCENFFQYWLSAVASNAEEDYELRLWMLNLFAHYVAVNKNWFETSDESKYWEFLYEEDWEVPPPPWAITSEKNSDEYRSWVEEERQKLLK